MADGAVGQGEGGIGLDDADSQQGGQDAVADPGQVGAVGEMPGGGGDAAGGGAHQELRAGGLDILGELVPVEAGICQQKHRAVQHAQQMPRIGEFTVALGSERGGQHRAGEQAPPPGRDSEETAGRTKASPSSPATNLPHTPR